MTFSIYDSSAPVFVNALTDMRAWLDKAAAEKGEAELLEARLAPDMRPLPAQYQMASDTAKNGIARLCGIEAPSMADITTHSSGVSRRPTRSSVNPSAFTRTASTERSVPPILHRMPGATAETENAMGSSYECRSTTV